MIVTCNSMIIGLEHADAEIISPIRPTSRRSVPQSVILRVGCIASDSTLLLYGIFNVEVRWACSVF